MVEAAVTVVLSKLQEVATAEATALLKVDDQIRNLRRGLVYLQAEVRGADQQRHVLASELLLLWAREARAVTFDVEDAVDEFHLKVEAFQVWGKPGRQATWYASAVKMLNGLAMQFFVRHGLSREISKINERIEEISKIKRSYNIESTPTKHWSLPSTDADVVWDIEDNGPELRYLEFMILKEQILSPPPPGKSMPGRANNILIIHGESGTGKTRLARRLYNDHEVREMFEVFAWICLPPRLRFEELSNMVLEMVRSQVRKNHEHAAMDTLSELLRGRRYLVVLDGLVDVGNWNSLQLDLLAAASGAAEDPGSRSIVLVTTQLKEKEILKREANKTFKLGPLDANETLNLFHERIAGDRLGNDEWERMCRDFSGRIHGVTRGLPLAVVVLGGVLRTKAFPSEWKEVFARELETAAGEPRAVRRLWLLALEELPSHLKSCFLYLATAPENVLLDPARLVRLWVAEGFVAPSKGRTLEEVGLGYLWELVGRGLVEVAERDYAGAVTGVTVHSLLHGFVQAEAQESGFLDIHHNAGVLNPHAVRRLAIHNLVDSYVDIPDGFPKLRSLLCDFLELEKEQEEEDRGRHGRPPQQQPWHKWNPAEWLMRACGGGSDDSPACKKLSIITGSRFLRVIDLYGLLLGRVPDEIGGIIHLRYLGFRNCGNLSELPASISRLDNLQTLDLRKTPVGSVTDGIWDIRGLRHVLADELSLPTRCPARHLKQMQTLTAVTIAPGGGGGCCPLNHMLYLRSLAVSSIPDSAGTVAALLSALRRMESLVSLSLSGRLVPSGVLSSPSSRRLRDLALHGKLDPSSPSGPFILPNLCKLSLSGSDNNLGKDFVKKLAELPNLAEMELLDGCYGEAQLVLEGGFPSLAKLTLNNLAQLEDVRREGHGSAPELAVLTHSGCNNIKVYGIAQRMTAPSSNTFGGYGTTLEEEVIGKEKVGDEVGNKEEPEEYNQRMEGTNSEVKRSFVVTTDPEDVGHSHSGEHHRVRIRRSAPSYDDDD